MKPASPYTLRSLGSLKDPQLFNEPLALDGFDRGLLIENLERMLLIRACEEKLADMKRNGLIHGPVHLGIGQEAIAVGVSNHLRKSDRVFGTHRSHPHVLALGATPERLFSEVTGRSTGMSCGMGGSMHLWDASIGFHGSAPIVAGTVPVAVGAGLAAKMDGKGDIAVAYFGDGACEEGVVHESLNLARLLHVPVLFVVENNLFSSHLHVSLRQPSDCMARFADAHGVPSEVVDGNDIIAVSRAAKDLVDLARNGHGPGFLEAVTYRWRGHVDWREDVDVGVNRSADDLARWKGRDPVRRLADALTKAESMSKQQFARLVSTVRKRVDDAWSASQLGAFPHARAIQEYVYATRSQE